MAGSHLPDEWNNHRKMFDEALSLGMWSACVSEGLSFLVAKNLDDGLSPDQPANDDMHLPLHILALQTPAHAVQAKGHIETARLLIARGATLTLPDHKGLLPADYAMIGPNPSMAATIILATLRHQHDRNILNPFRPRFDILFATMPLPDARAAAHAHLERNIPVIKAALQHGPHNLPDVDTAYWLALTTPALSSLPRPPNALREQFHAVQRLIGSQSPDPMRYKTKLATFIQEEKAHLRFLEWQTAQKLRL